MDKLTIRAFVILLLFLSASLFGQSKYPYWYQIHLDFQDDVTAAKIDTTSEEKNVVSLFVKNQIGEELGFGTVTLQSKDTLITQVLDENGHLRLPLKNNLYTIRIQSLDFKPWTGEIQVNNNGLKIDLTAARVPQLEGYIVQSKTKMTEKELHEIKKCLESSKDNKACEVKKKFIILIEI